MPLKERTSCADCSDDGTENTCNHPCADHKREIVEPSEALHAKVLSYEHPELVHRIATDHGVSENVAKSWFKEGLTYLYRAATTGEPLSPSVEADRAWHAFLLYSRDYREFCQEMFGFFIDHCPTPKLAKL